jgi:hypothetical protein
MRSTRRFSAWRVSARGSKRRPGPSAPPCFNGPAYRYRINFEIGRELAQDVHHPGAHVAVERVIARPDDHAFGIDPLTADMPGLTHGDAERLRFVRARDDTTIVVGQHDNRFAAQPRLKHALARRIEVIAIDERNRSSHGCYSIRMDFVTTPQTSKLRSAVTSMSGKAGLSACSTMLFPRRR